MPNEHPLRLVLNSKLKLTLSTKIEKSYLKEVNSTMCRMATNKFQRQPAMLILNDAAKGPFRTKYFHPEKVYCILGNSNNLKHYLLPYILQIKINHNFPFIK